MRHVPMKADRNLDKKAENIDLHDEPKKNNVITEVDGTLRLRLAQHAAACALNEETEHITKDEKLCHYGWVYDGDVVAIESMDEAPEDGVDGGREEDRCEENEKGLDDVRS
jgi:hypothetical protein